MGPPSISISSRIQSPLGLLRPGMWLPGVRNFHCHKESWLCDASEKDRVTAVLESLKRVKQEDDTNSFYDIHKVTDNFVRIFVFTFVEWLDIIEIEMKPNITHVTAFSSGFLPLCIPFACVINLALFWIPFSDMGQNKRRVDALKERISLQIQVINVN
ncbi:hypothetical protein SNE40_004131 [Patella caerulea]|uniref:Uncharacterized protein n=1 Tax=Patella caerulea TaxID=87958 RepID=A0AAN8KFS5_PATCE